MSKAQASPRRVRVEHNIYKRIAANGKPSYEVVYRDSTGVQRHKATGPKISVARAERDSILGRRGSGERVQPNPQLRFSDAADQWLAVQVAAKRPATQASYTGSVESHLRPRWGNRRMDRITTDDAARLIQELREEGKAEATIESICKAARRVFKFARRRMSWHGESPFDALEAEERPKLSGGSKRRIFEGSELAETIGAAQEPYGVVFAFAACTGARKGECLGLVWSDFELADLDTASVSFVAQLDRDSGERAALKTDESRRTVELPRSLAAWLVEHKVRSAHSRDDDFVFSTRTGRAVSHRNCSRELRRAQRNARGTDGSSTFPVLHAVDADGKPLPVPRKSVPSFHSFRDTAASEAIRDGESAEEVSWQLGHLDSTVTRRVYIQEIKSAERSRKRRDKFEARIAPVLLAAQRS